MKLAITAVDSDYTYIQTFIQFLDNIVIVIGHLFEVIGGAFEKFSK